MDEPDDVVHALTHLNSRESWLTSLKVELIDIIFWVYWLHSFDVVFVTDLVHLEQLLVFFTKFFFHIGIYVFKFETLLVPDAHFAAVDFETRSNDLTHLIVE